MKGIRMIRLETSAAKASAVIASTLMMLLTGCGWWQEYYRPPPPVALGALSDPVWKNQEANAEPSEFVVYQHEFQQQAEWLNNAGEDHVKQIAARLQAGQDLQVIVERSMSSPREGAEYPYPVHPNPELDMRRREIIVRSLAAMGIEDAEERVVVAPAFAEGFTGSEAEAAYRRGLGPAGFGVPGLGGAGGFGGFIFRGGF